MKKREEIPEIFIRYGILMVIAFFGVPLLYKAFLPLTIYPVYFLLGLFFEVSLNQVFLTISNGVIIEIVGACVGASAYYLLLILNLSVPKINIEKRIRMIILAFLAFLLMNILRIFFLAVLLVNQSLFFDVTHKIFWYFLSTLFVVVIWFSGVKFFNIKEIPFYSDLKYIYKKIKN